MPDAVLLDWNMPVMDGYDFLKALRRMPGGDGPQVVFCTTENDVAHIARALSAGANEYIMKPFDKEIVEAKFQEVGMTRRATGPTCPVASAVFKCAYDCCRYPCASRAFRCAGSASRYDCR